MHLTDWTCSDCEGLVQRGRGWGLQDCEGFWALGSEVRDLETAETVVAASPVIVVASSSSSSCLVVAASSHHRRRVGASTSICSARARRGTPWSPRLVLTPLFWTVSQRRRVVVAASRSHRRLIVPAASPSSSSAGSPQPPSRSTRHPSPSEPTRTCLGPDCCLTAGLGESRLGSASGGSVLSKLRRASPSPPLPCAR